MEKGEGGGGSLFTSIFLLHPTLGSPSNWSVSVSCSQLKWPEACTLLGRYNKQAPRADIPPALSEESAPCNKDLVEMEEQVLVTTKIFRCSISRFTLDFSSRLFS